MKTVGEIEASVCAVVRQFELDYMGRGPQNVRAHLIRDLLLIRLEGVLTAAEQQLVKTQPAEKGRDLLKQVRTHLIETARPQMEMLIETIGGVKVRSLHHDISTTTGEEIVVFTLEESPRFREAKPRLRTPPAQTIAPPQPNSRGRSALTQLPELQIRQFVPPQ